jgi:pyruvate dehydrogenase E1 component alpha subunit
VKEVLHEFKVERLQILDEKGNCDESLMPKLSDKQIKELYEKMILARTFDNKALNMQRQGRIGSYLEIKGQEASQIGCVSALKDKDYIFPMYRSSGALLARKQPMHLLFLYWGGDERGLRSPDNVNNFPLAIPVGTQIAHASGAGWAAKLKKEDTVSMVFFGDGASSKAEFHTGMNFASVYGANTIFVCENNQFAISTPVSHQTGAKTIAQKAIAYGMNGIQVDGNDIFAVYKAASDAVKNARKGIPTLIECLTYRMSDHSTSDDASKYRKQKDVDEWAKKDPVNRLEIYMKSKKLLDAKYKKKVLDDSKKLVESEVKKYESYPPQKEDEIFSYTFKEMTPVLKEQYKEYKEAL